MGEGKLVSTSFPSPIPLSFQKLLLMFLGRNLFGEKCFAPNPTSKSLEVVY